MGFSPSHAVGYSSNNSSLTDLSHRRSGSGGSASTGIGSILEHSDQQVERGEKENKTTPPVPATYHHTFDSPAIHLKAQRWYRQLLWPWNSMLLIRWWSFDHYYIISMLYLTWWQCIVFPSYKWHFFSWCLNPVFAILTHVSLPLLDTQSSRTLWRISWKESMRPEWMQMI